MSPKRFHSKTRTWLRFTLALMLVSLFVGANVTTAQASTQVGGPITTNTTWTVEGNSYIVIADVEVVEGVTLTIKPGVVVRFESGHSLLVSGTLIAQGTLEEPIRFTSSDLGNPTPGDWGNIEFTDKAVITSMDANGNYVSGSILQYCVVEYANGSSDYDQEDSAIYARSLMIDHCTVRLNRARGIYDQGTATAPGRVTNNIIGNNATNYNGGGINARYSTVSGNTLSNNSSSNGGGIYASFSTVSGNTLNYNFGSRGGGVYAYNSTVATNTIHDNSGGSGGGIYADGGSVSENTVTNNIATTDGGGIYSNSSTVYDNTVTDNTATADGGGIYTRFGTVSGSVINNNSAGNNGGGIYAFNTTVTTNTITINTVSAKSGGGSGVYTFGTNDFLYNTVVGNQGPSNTQIGGLEINGTPKVQDNNLYGNQPYDVTIDSSSPVTGTLNYWGTTVSADIPDQIYDGQDDSSRGELFYTPFSQALSSQAPLPPPLSLVADTQNDSVTLSWQAIPGFAAGWGYRMYYDNDSPLPPFAGSGLTEGNSPIDAGAKNTFTLTGLDPDKDYYLAVTVYDDQTRESWYSNVIWKRSIYRIYLPIIDR